jgi:hypothetical protein
LLQTRITELELQLREMEQNNTQLSRSNSTYLSQVVQSENTQRQLERTAATLRRENAALQEKARAPPVPREQEQQLAAENERLKLDLDALRRSRDKLKVTIMAEESAYQKVAAEHAELKAAVQRGDLIREAKADIGHSDSVLKKIKEDTVREVEQHNIAATDLIDHLMLELTRSYENYERLAGEYAKLRGCL